MNELFIPPPINWYQFNSMDCASDNTVVYCSRKDIIIILPTDPSEPADIREISGAHSEKVYGVSLNHSNWGDPDKLIASIGDDNVVRLWDMTTGSLKMNHKEHMKYDDMLVGVSIAGDRVITVSEKGIIMVWRISLNKVTKFEDLFQRKVKVMCMSSCPHAQWLTAFGLRGGLIVVADLRKGRILHRMKGNDHDVTSLSWCPAPINIYKTEVGEYVNNVIKKTSKSKNKRDEKVKDKASDKPDSSTDTETIINVLEEKISELQEKISDLNIVNEVLGVDTPIYNLDDRKKQTYEKVSNKNPWGNVQFNDSDTEGSPNVSKASSSSDFLQDCTSLRDMIKKRVPVSEEKRDDSPEIPQGQRKIIKAMRNKKLETDDTEIEQISNSEETKKKEVIISDEDNCKNEDLKSPKPEEEEMISPENTQEICLPDETLTLYPDDYNKEYLLASAAKSGDVFIWRGLTDGRLEHILGNPIKQKKVRFNKDTMRSKWIAVCWAKPDILLVSTLTNRVFCWNLFVDFDLERLTPKSTQEARLVHQDHSSVIFNIYVPHKVYPEIKRTLSWTELDDFFIWTTAKDRLILCTTIGTQRKTLVSYPCLSCGVNCIASSPIDPSKLAIGLFDCAVKIWDLSLPHTQVISMIKLLENMQDKIVAIGWHPEKDNHLAFSTADGRVARILTNNKTQVFFHPHHRNPAYTIQWAPSPDKNDEYALFSCSFGDLIYHNESEPTLEPTSVNLDDGRAHTFAWSSNYSILAVGTKEGSVKLLSKKFNVYETLYMQKKAIQCLAWHPEATAADTGASPYSNYLAVSANEPNIYIYNCRTAEEVASGERTSLIAVLEGHNSSVKWLSWCPQVGGRLATGAEDSVVMVWNVKTQTLLSTFKWEGKDVLKSLIWSPLDADLIILGGRTQCIKIFRITKHPPAIFEKTEKKKSSPKQITEKSSDNDNDNDSESVSSSVPEKSKRQFVLIAMAKLQNPDQADNVGILKKLMEFVENKTGNNEEKEIPDEECAADGEMLLKDINVDVTQMFSSREDMKSILNYEQQRHFANRQIDSMHHISMWNGDLAQSIEKSLKCGVVNPWIISMAPMVSHTLWSKLCLVYADQLAEEGQGLEASSYYLACHQVHKAVHALCASNLYREALALTKIRLPDDPIINDVYDQWATYCIINGNYEVAAQCLIMLEKFSEAAMVLNKRIDPEKLQLALELAKRGENHDLQIAIEAKLELLNQQKQVRSDQDVQIAIDPDPKNQGINILPSRFEALMTSIQEININNGLDVENIEAVDNEKDKTVEN